MTGTEKLRQDLERAEEEARKLQAKGIDACVVPIVVRVAGTHLTVGYDVDVRVHA